MFAGHFGVGFGMKRAAPTLSLGWLFLAVNLVDIAWSFFVLIGLEHVAIDPGNTAVTPLNFYDYPYTHSLVATCAWMLAAYLIFRVLPIGVREFRNRYAALLAIAVGSHFVLDLIVHRPDLPMWGGSGMYLGLGLWRHPLATAVLEMGIVALGFLLYMFTTRAKNRWGKIGPWLLVLLLVAIQMSAYFGPPPPNVTMIGVVGLIGQLLLVALAFAVDRARGPRMLV